MAVSGLNGGSTDANHLGWFELSDFDLAAFRNIVGGKNSAPQFGVVNVILDQHVALTRFLTHMSGGNSLGSVRIEGVVGDGANQKAVYDLTLSSAYVTNLSDVSNGGFGLELDYRFVELKTQDQMGKSTGLVQWDTHKNTATNVAIAAPIIGSNAGTSTPNTTAVTYFLNLDKVGGNSLDAKFKGALEIGGFSLDTSRAETLPGQYGTLSLGNIAISVNDDAALARLLAHMASGKILGGATITGRDAADRDVYFLKLDDVLVTSLNDVSGGGFNFELDYGQITVATKGVTTTGTLVDNTAFIWDTVANNALTGATGSAFSGGLVSIAPTQYFMVVNGQYGGSQAPGFTGAFDISAFSIDAGNSGVVDGSGAGAGKFSLGGLSVTVKTDIGLSNLLKLESLGTLLNGVRIMGVNDAG
jgi:type VI protein secretion system component Hcp